MEILIKAFIHDINNPLHILKNLCRQGIKILENSAELSDGERAKQIEIWNKAQGMATIVERCVAQTLSVIQAAEGTLRVNWQESNLQLLSKQTFESFKGLAFEKNINFIFRVIRQADRPTFTDPEILLDHILFNLVFNALKFCQTEGEVCLEIDEVKGKVVIKVINSSDFKTAQALQERFQSLEGNQGQSENGTAGERGFGLGLMVTKKMCDILKIDLKIEYEKDIKPIDRANVAFVLYFDQ